MKSICFSVALLMSSSVFATANCNGNLEAEFIAQASNVYYTSPEAGAAESTSYMLSNFRLFQVNQLCPLDQALAAKAVISVNSYLNIQNGQEVSGVLVYNPKFNIFSIE